MRVSFAIMASPKRRDMALDVQRAVESDGAQCPVHWSSNDPVTPWVAALPAWMAFDRDADWHVVLQDDIAVCPRFVDRVTAALTGLEHADPTAAVASFFSMKQRRGEGGFTRCSTVSSACALAMHTDVIPQFLRWVDEHVDPSYPHDDARIAIWMIYTGRWAYVSNPSLVEHLDGGSLAGNRLPGRPRTAAIPFTSYTTDALQERVWSSIDRLTMPGHALKEYGTRWHKKAKTAQ